MTWVASKLSGAASAMGAEAIELRNWLLHFGCTLDDSMVVVAKMSYWTANSSPPWAAYCELMDFRLVALDKRLVVRPVVIGETLCKALAKLVMRAAGNQAEMVCGNLQLCAGLEDGIEGATHDMGQQILDWLRERRSEEEARTSDEEEDDDNIVAVLGNIIIETAGTEDEAEKCLEAALDMEI